MKLLAITDSYPPHHSGGYELRCKEVLDRLVERGHTVEIITTRCADEKCDLHHPENENIHRELHRIRETDGVIKKVHTEYTDLRYIQGKIKEVKPDLIYLWHIVNFTRSLFPYLAGIDIPIVFDEGGKGIAWAWTHHGFWYNLVEKRCRSLPKNAARKILGMLGSRLSSNVLKQDWQWPKRLSGYFNSLSGMEYARELGVPLHGCSVIHSGMSLKEFPFVPKAGIGSPVQILLPGRIAEIKGQKDIVQVLLGLKKENLSAHATIVGDVFSETYHGGLVQEIGKHGLGAQVSILPKVEHAEMKDLYRAADVCFFPSYQKFGLSRVPLEAMACGCLLFTYGNEGSDEIVQDRQTGFILPEGQIAPMVGIIREFSTDREKYRQMVQNGRKWVEENHTMDLYMDKIERFLNRAAVGQNGKISS